MKPAKSPLAVVELSPGAKKLKQARLPFKILSDVSPKPDTSTRKRKLSDAEIEVAKKINKISKENDLKDELVVISDEDSKEGNNSEHEKAVNPFVKLVDVAYKKRIQKAKKKKGKNKANKRKSETNSTLEDETCNEDVEMEVDEVEVCNDSTEKEAQNEKTANSDKNLNSTTKLKNNDCSAKKSLFNTKTENEKSDKVEPVNEMDEESNASAKQIEDCDTKEDNDIEQKKPQSHEENPDLQLVTPKRSARVKASKESVKSSLNDSVSSSKLDESVSSNTSTPKQIKKQGSKDGDLNTSLTPKQMQRKLESAKKKEEKERERLEREKKRQEEKEERDKIKREREEAKKKEREEKEEAKKKEREEKEEAKKKDKEEKEKQKELEKKLKEEKEELRKKEREEKEEQRRKEKEARDEEKRKRQEALDLEKQEQELKKKKAAEAFANFFVPKQKVEKVLSVAPLSKNDVLSSFTIKTDMRLAPTIRSHLTDDRKSTLDHYLVKQGVDKEQLYVKSLRDGNTKPESCGKTWPLSEKDDDVVLVEDELPLLDGAGEVLTCESAVREKLRPKLFSFHENRRPPYWGTWRKKSTCITPRRPFGQDEKVLDYEVDSDDEWEEEQEGESIDGSAAGSDAEADNDEYEVDNEVFVPHGYLSDEEATMDEDDVSALTPEAQAARLKHLEDEFETELKKPTEKLKPRLYGLIWQTSDGGKPDNCVDALWNYFGKLFMIMDDPTELLKPALVPEETEKKKIKKKKVNPDGETPSPKSEKKKKNKTEAKETKPKAEIKKTPEVKKNQLGINTFLKKLKSQ